MVVAAVYMQDKSYLNDCPQRNVVLMQSSVKLVGSLHHSAARRAMFLCFYVLCQISDFRCSQCDARERRKSRCGEGETRAKTRESTLTLVSPCSGSGSCSLQRQQHHQLKHRVFVFGPLLNKLQRAF